MKSLGRRGDNAVCQSNWVVVKSIPASTRVFKRLVSKQARKAVAIPDHKYLCDRYFHLVHNQDGLEISDLPGRRKETKLVGDRLVELGYPDLVQAMTVANYNVFAIAGQETFKDVVSAMKAHKLAYFYQTDEYNQRNKMKQQRRKFR